jgi:heat shock protein HslJ
VKPLACALIAALAAAGWASQAAAAEPLHPTAHYTARGNEPGWSVDIDSQRMRLVLDNGERKIVTRAPRTSRIAGGRRFSARAAGRQVTVDAVNRICRDTMSGMSFPDTVTVRAGDWTLHGCGGEPASLIEGAEWTVESIDGHGVVGGSRVTLHFGEGRVSGSAGCNRFMGPYHLTGESLEIGPAAAGRMACEPALMSQETTFLKLLEAVRKFELTNDGALVLVADDGRKILARRPARPG